MDKETRRAAVRAFLRGERVAVFCRSWDDARELLRLVVADLPESPGFRVSYAAGRLGIVPLGLRGMSDMRFYSVRSSGHRGWSCDRVFVPADVPDDVLAAIVPMTAASRVGETTRY
ncbi:hypothetical protein HYQ03_gp01 [Arthrobacter phage Kuleana]|uniref:Uncharacterized protein n=1 Tax=Arthrobacter phage Kuleana TaxID=2653270 RepID=A0A5Q2WEJ4_9CAUD|nr:hypothetical protein HYQ03_gp01 [Arthrobacter phage Kuleana]QGH74488.1 hypothetical protein SEA_KULEANA_1 [Arthrobacter phage Kuleana]